jgi:serpin B
MSRKIVGLALFFAACVGCVDWDGPLVAPPQPPGAEKALHPMKACPACNAFALDLYAQLRGQDGNLFFSPFSISTALAMTRAGARGDTAAEMDRVLHFTLPGPENDAAFDNLTRAVNADAHGCQLNIANSLWGQKDAGFTPGFLKRTRDYYGAGFQEVDFKTAPDKARRTINAWVERQTRDRIKDLIAQGMLTSESRLVLTNAIYFKGNWASRFQKGDTDNGAFHLAAGRDVNAPLMHRTDGFGYADSEDCQALEMPYAGGGPSMVVLLPHKVDGLAELEAGLTAEKLDACLRRLVKQDVIVTFPKFKAQYLVSLGNVLSHMGMSLAFSDAADFSGMNGGKEPLKISDVVHKAWIDTNEEGTEAAAATAVVMTLAAAPNAPQPPTPVFRADHPFLFLIRDANNGCILFLGRVTDPTK